MATLFFRCQVMAVILSEVLAKFSTFFAGFETPWVTEFPSALSYEPGGDIQCDISYEFFGGGRHWGIQDVCSPPPQEILVMISFVASLIPAVSDVVFEAPTSAMMTGDF